MAGVGAMPNHFAEVITASTSDFVPKIMTDVGAQYKDFKLATREVVSMEIRATARRWKEF